MHCTFLAIFALKAFRALADVGVSQIYASPIVFARIGQAGLTSWCTKCKHVQAQIGMP